MKWTINPIPTSERMPAPSDCLGRPFDSSDVGHCWVWTPAYERWTLRAVVFPRPYPDPPVSTIPAACSHWLPHWALPIPTEGDYTVPISEQAQAVLDVFRKEWEDEPLKRDAVCLAAVIRALVESVHFDEHLDTHEDYEVRLLAIAAEMEDRS